MMTQPADLSGLLWKVANRTGLSRLADTEAGDVFFLVADPSQVYTKKISPHDRHFYTSFTDDVWRKAESVGDGTDSQIVMVIHNTQKTLREPGGSV